MRKGGGKSRPFVKGFSENPTAVTRRDLPICHSVVLATAKGTQTLN
jgi:hypothetical protein